MAWFRGVFIIPCTPFTQTGELDETSLRRQIAFCLECGVDGVVAPANAGEFYTLTDDERKRVVEVVSGELGGRVPFIAGCTAVSAAHAVMLARHAEQCGARGVMAMPPVIRKAAGEEIFDYYAALAGSISIPVVLQDFFPPLGTPMPPELMARMVREIPGVRYVKEETTFGPHVLTRVRELCGEALEGIMGGQGGRFLFDEVARGACGTMPAAHLADLHVDVWAHLQAGRAAEARALFNRMLPMLNFEGMYAVQAYKEVLRRRSVLATSFCRGGTVPLDGYDLAELELILADLAPLFRVR